MKNSTKIIIAVVAIVVIIAVVAIVILNSKSKSKLDIKNAEDLSTFIDKLYEGKEGKIPNTVNTQIIDLADTSAVESFTGLNSADDLECLAVSEPMISSQAYSLIIAKVKDGVNANQVAEAIKDGVNPRKWICVTANKVYATSSGNVAFLVMSNEDMAKPIYDRFKELAGNIGKEFERTVEDELPNDDIPGFPTPGFEIPDPQ